MSRNSLVGLSVVGLAIAATAALVLSYASRAQAHCQIPCGIYDDPARIAHLREDATTIAKAITNINELSGRNEANAFNQAARWVAAKEAHASDIITVVAEYFLTQKLKPVAAGSDGYDAYLKKLADHHGVLVAAMKTKQSADPASVANLTKAIDKLAGHY